MNKLKKTLKQLWQDESGQGAMEYILMGTVVVVIIIAFKGKIEEVITNKTSDLEGKLGEAMKLK